MFYYWNLAGGKVYTDDFDESEIPRASYGEIIPVAANKRLAIVRLNIRIKGPLVGDALALRFGATANVSQMIGIWFFEVQTAGTIGTYDVIFNVPPIGGPGQPLYGFTADITDAPAFTIEYMLIPVDT